MNRHSRLYRWLRGQARQRLDLYENPPERLFLGCSFLGVWPTTLHNEMSYSLITNVHPGSPRLDSIELRERLRAANITMIANAYVDVGPAGQLRIRGTHDQAPVAVNTVA